MCSCPSVFEQTRTARAPLLVNSMWVSCLSGDSGGGGGLPVFVCFEALTILSQQDPLGLRPANADAQVYLLKRSLFSHASVHWRVHCNLTL